MPWHVAVSIFGQGLATFPSITPPPLACVCLLAKVKEGRNMFKGAINTINLSYIAGLKMSLAASDLRGNLVQ